MQRPIVSRALCGKDVILVGGQAVNLWALSFQEKCPRLLEFLPFTSRDSDIFGDIDTLERLAQETGWPSKRIRKVAATPTVGFLTGPGDTTIEVLFSVRGVTSKEIHQNKTSITIDDHEYWTINPILLLKSKIANADELPQKDRQDIKHIKMLILCVAEYIDLLFKKWRANKITERDLVKILVACRRTITSRKALKIQKAHGLALGKCFPAGLESHGSKKVSNFCSHWLKDSR